MGKAFQIFCFFFFLKVLEGLIMIISELKGKLTAVLCGFFSFLCKRVEKKGGGGKVDYSCLNCQDVKRRLLES